MTPDGAGGDFQDLEIESTGQIILTSGWGDGSSARGLLAGENLETLVRLTDALPPQSYAPSEPCRDGFFLVIHGAQGETRYASGVCDATSPQALRTLAGFLSGLVAGVHEPRMQVVPFKVLASGQRSGIHSAERVVARSEQELSALLRRHAVGVPVVFPRVDFSREMLVAEFLGDRPGSIESISVASADRNDLGWMRIHMQHEVPAAGCAAGPGMTQPFVMFSVEKQDGNVLFDTETKTVACR